MIKKSVLFATALLSSASPLVMASDLMNVESGRPKQQQINLPAVGEFPNYFDYLESQERLRLVEQSFASILAGLQIPHHMEQNTVIEYDDFFKKIVELVHKHDAGAKVYVAGGMVRSLLGYDYKKLYRAVEKNLVKSGVSGSQPEPTETIVQNALQRLINGQPTKRRHYLKTLGISSDFDILIDFTETLAENLQLNIIKIVTKFINSAESFLGLTKEQSKIKKSVVPVGDVKDYQKQIGTKGDRSAVLQGGLTLDWLAFDLVDHKIRMPDGHQDILDVFFKGKLQYLTVEGKVTADKQTIRALRPLLEIPFASYDEAGEKILAAELQTLAKTGVFSSDAEEQIEKMIRNAREGSAHNLLAKPTRGPTNPHVRQSAKQMSDKFKSKNSKILPPAAEFLETKNIQLRQEDKGGLKTKNILMPVELFLTNHTSNGIVQHGTPDLVNVMNMMRNGFLISKDGQGNAAYGSGFYTAKDVRTAETYAKTEGIVIPLQINSHNNLRILDLDTPGVKQFITEVQKKFPNQDINEILANEYDVDIIINSYIIIQNAAALKLPKDIKLLIQAQIDQTEKEMREKLKNDPEFGAIKFYINKWFHHLHPKKGFAQLLLCLGGKPANKGLDVLSSYLEKQVQKENSWAAHVLLSNQTAFNYSEKAFQILDKSIRTSTAVKLHEDFTKKWYELQSEQGLNEISLEDVLNSFKKGYVADKTDNHSALLKAVEAGNFEAVKFLVQSGADLDSRDLYKETALSIAAKKNHVEILNFLTIAGADIDSKNNKGRTPLSLAAADENIEAMKFLIDKKANMDAKDDEGNSVICHAAINGKLDAVKLLVEKGADRLARNNSGNTPFGNAVSHGKADVADYLFGLGGVQINEEDNFGNTLLALACFYGSLDSVKDLHVKGLKIDKVNNGGSSPLSLAARKGNLDVIKYLVENKVDLNMRNSDGCSPLEEAVSWGHVPCAQYLLENGADKNTKNNEGETLLTVAAQKDHAPMVKFLVEQGLDINVFLNAGTNLLRPTGESLISWAAEKNDSDLVQLLIERGADINTELKDGQPLIAWALENKHANVFKAMAGRGYDFKWTDQSGKALLQLAMEQYYTSPDMIHTLIENGGDITTTDVYDDPLIFWAALGGHLETVKLLLDKGESIERKNKYGSTLLHEAATWDNLEIVQLLVEKGLDPKQEDKFGVTPYMKALERQATGVTEYLESINANIITPGQPSTGLIMRAAEEGKLELLRILIEKGIPLDSKDTNGETPLIRAAERGKLEMVRFLIENGADKRVKNKFGASCLHQAASMGKTDVVAFLIKCGLDVNESDDLGRTPLFSASYEKETFEYLLDNGADVTVFDFFGRNIAHHCAAENKLKALESLASRGIQLDRLDKNQNPVLCTAAKGGEMQALQWLLDRGVNIEQTNSKGETALMQAFEAGEMKAVELLLERGANLRAADTEGNNLLHREVLSGRDNHIDFLLDKGIPIESVDTSGSTAFRLACEKGNISIANMLLERGAQINTKDNAGNTPLAWTMTTFFSRKDVTSFLIAKRADVNIRNNFGQTPFSLAAGSCELETVETLVINGADLNTQDNKGRSPLYHAAIRGHEKVTNYLLEKQTVKSLSNLEQTAVLMLTVAQGKMERAQELLSIGISVNVQDADGRTPISHVVEKGKLEMFQFLESQGADLSIPDNNGKKPIDYVFSPRSDSRLVQMFMERGCGLDYQNQGAVSLLNSAIRNNDIDFVKELVDKGVNINGIGSYGYTPLGTATTAGFVNIVEFLLEFNVDLTPVIPHMGTALGAAKTVQNAIKVSSKVVQTYLEKHNNDLYATADLELPAEILRLRNLAKIIIILEAKGAK